jgi:hypothetical protein
MLPWQVCDGTNELTSGNADISRAVMRILSQGFLLRDRLEGDLFQMVLGGFLRLSQVMQFIENSTLEQTFGPEANRLLRGSELQGSSVSGSSFIRYADMFMASYHGSNWPQGLKLPLTTGIEQGVVTNLKAILDNADQRVGPLLKQEISVTSDGSDPKPGLAQVAGQLASAIKKGRLAKPAGRLESQVNPLNLPI